MPKVAELDHLINESNRDSIIEVHPECTFKTMNCDKNFVEEDIRGSHRADDCSRSLRCSILTTTRRSDRRHASMPTRCCERAPISTWRTSSSVMDNAMHAASRCESFVESQSLRAQSANASTSRRA